MASVPVLPPDASLEEVVATMESRGVRRVLVKSLMTLIPGASPAPAVTDAQLHAQFLLELDRQSWAGKGAVDAEVRDRVIELRGIAALLTA